MYKKNITHIEREGGGRKEREREKEREIFKKFQQKKENMGKIRRLGYFL